MPSSTDAEPKRNELSVESLGRATRFAVGMIVVVLSYLPLRASFAIPKFQQIFQDMLGTGTVLPAATRFVLGTAHLLMGATVLLFVCAIGTFVLRNIRLALHIQGVVGLLAVVFCVLTYYALFQPLAEIVQGMQRVSPGFDPALIENGR